MYIIFGFIIGILIYLVVKYPDRGIGTKPRPDIKYEKGLPIIGNLRLYTSVTYFMYDTLIKYGPTTTYTIGPSRAVTVNNPELLEHVLKTKFDNYVKGPEFSQVVYDVLGNGIFSSDGKMWKFQRKLVSHLFNGKNFRDIICVVFEEETKTLLNILKEAVEHDEIIDLQDLFYRFTLDSFGRITLGTDFECLLHPKEPVLFAQKFDFVQSVLEKRFKNPLWPIIELFTEEGAKMRSACDYLTNYAYNIINKRKDDEEALKDPKDILNMFMNAVIVDDDEIGNARKLSDKELRDIVLNLIIAGRDTTAQALSWMMYNIIMNPSVEEKLVNEVNSLLVPENPILNYDNIKKFQYTQAVFHETLRLHPSVPKNTKKCIKDDVLPNGIPIYVGEHISWSSWAMGRDERIWGEDAKKFIPERFLEDEKPNQFKFSSFNCGPRLCLGQTFATVEAMTVATAMLKQFKFELLPGQKTPPDFKESLTLPMKDPLLVKVHIR